MKIIIPVAGVGTRLRPHTLTQPKVLLNVAGHPMIYYIVDEIIRKKIAGSIVFITGYKGEDIKEYLDTNFKFNFEYAEQKDMLGLGHAILCAKECFDKSKNEPALIILGDTLFDVDLEELTKKEHSVIGVKKVDDPRRFGVVETNKEGFITRFVEKPASKEISPSNEAIVGIYKINNSNLLFESIEYIIENKITTKNEYQLTDALEQMIKQGEKFQTFNIHGWLDCGKHETMLETNHYLLDKYKKEYDYKSCKINYPVHIGKNVVLENCIIGPYATINDGSTIKNSIISNSIIDINCTIENNIIKDSLIGKHSKLIGDEKTLSLGEYSEI